MHIWDDHLDYAWRRVNSVGNLYHIKSANIERCEMLYFFICISLEKMQRKKKTILLAFFSLFLTFFSYEEILSFWLRNLFGWIDVMSNKVEPVVSGRWRIQSFCCRLWREEMAWWSNLESKTRWTDGGEAALLMDGCQAGGLKFHGTPEALFFLLTSRKSERQQ